MSASAIASFIGKYADEALSIADALTNVLEGLALRKDQADAVRATIDKLEAAAAGIKNSTTTIATIRKSDIEQAVAAYLEANLQDIVSRFVAEKVAAEANANADA